MTYDLPIFHGHGDGDNGACGNGYTELQLVTLITDKVNKILINKGLHVHSNDGQNNYNRDLTANNQYRVMCGLEIHLNSGGGTGCECIVPLNEKFLDIENDILNGLEQLGLKNRGLKCRDYNTENFVPVKSCGKDYYKVIRQAWEKSPKLSFSILEIGFIDNKNDVDIIVNNVDRIAFIIANSYLKYCGISVEPIPSTPTPDTNDNNKIYTVQVGAFKNKDNAIAMQNKLKEIGINSIIK